MAEAIRLRVAGGRGAPRRARGLIADRLRGTLDADALYDVEVLVSELVTNAVRHGGCGDRTEVDLRLVVGAGRIRVEVGDGGPGFRRPEKPTPRPDGGGNGLLLLELMSSRWDVEVSRGRTCVWFELEARRAA